MDLILVLSASWWPVDDLRKHEWRHDTVNCGHRGDLLPRWRFHLGLPETRICWVVHYHYHYHRTSAWLLIFISDLHAYEGLESITRHTYRSGRMFLNKCCLYLSDQNQAKILFLSLRDFRDYPVSVAKIKYICVISILLLLINKHLSEEQKHIILWAVLHVMFM